MSRRFAVPAVLLAAAVVPGGAQAAGHKHPGQHGQKVSINVTDNPVVTGEPLTIYGQLTAAHPNHRLVVLYHRIAGQSRFTVVQRGYTNASGFYSFARADGVVRTNRNWYVKAATARSRTLHERVYAEVSLNQPTGTFLTNHRVRFTGTVTPGGVHQGDRVVLQQQVGVQGDHWRTVDAGRVHGGSYAIDHRFKFPGSKTLRVVLPRDRYNLRSESTPVSFEIEQAQNAKFTISASDQQVNAGDDITVSGVLAPPNNGDRAIDLYARSYNGKFHKVASTTSDASGNYSFTQSDLASNTVYRAESGTRHSRQLFVGVHDVVSISASSTTSTVGGSATISGTVQPNKAGHVVYLLRKGDDGAYHIIKVGRINGASQYSFAKTFRTTGEKTYRVLVPGGPVNERGLSDAVTVTVS